MYDIGKILTVGGSQNYDAGPGSNRAYRIDINGSEPTVKRTRNDMQFARAMVNSVVLPNVEVVVIGGQTSVKLFSDENAVLAAEIWSPLTETFRTLKPMIDARNYHAIAIIMKDGRVWVAGTKQNRTVVMRVNAQFLITGGGLCGCIANKWNFEILQPPYCSTSMAHWPHDHRSNQPCDREGWRCHSRDNRHNRQSHVCLDQGFRCDTFCEQ
jgi:galactose oxidase